MSTAETHEIADILDRIKTWPALSRVALARQILESVEAKPVIEPPPSRSAAAPTRGVPVERVLGMLKTDREPPNDEECRRIVEEERWKKYGS